MFTTEYLKKIYEYYDEEIDTQSFQDTNMQTLLKTLILYKELSKDVPSYKYKSGAHTPLKLWYLSKGAERDRMANAIVAFPLDSNIVQSQWFDKNGWYEKLLSTFVNRQLDLKSDEEEQCKIYIDAESCSVYIELPNSMSLDGIHMLLCGLISKLMPWFFSSVDRDVVVQITKALDDHGDNGFNELFERTIKDTGIPQRIMEKGLQELGEKLKRTEVDDARDRVRGYQDQVDSYFRTMCEYNDKLREAKKHLAAITMDDDRDSGIKEVVEFLQGTTQDIIIDQINGYTINLIIRTTFQAFDEWETYTNMASCYLYESSDYGLNYSERSKRAYTKLFSDNNFKIHTAVGISLNLRTGEVWAFTPQYDENESEHPHLNAEYSCFGTAGNAIAEYIKDFRYTEALNQIAYAARQFTVSDGAAGNKLLRGMRNNACIELPNGEFTNMHGLLKYLDETEGELE